MLSILIVGRPIVFVFGGQFPGTTSISRLYAIHILLIPGIILALVTAHLMMVWYQKHTQFPGPGRTNDNVVGYRCCLSTQRKLAASSSRFSASPSSSRASSPSTRSGCTAHTPDQVTAGSQPDWYIGWLEGALRMMPNWETNLWGHTISWNILIPAVILPGIIFTLMALYPKIEHWITGDDGYHNLAERPAMRRPAQLGAMAITFYVLLWIGGGNDIIARFFDLSLNAITCSCVSRFSWCRRWCLSSPSASACHSSDVTATSSPWPRDGQHHALASWRVHRDPRPDLEHEGGHHVQAGRDPNRTSCG